MLLTYKEIATFTAGSHISRIRKAQMGPHFVSMRPNSFW